MGIFSKVFGRFSRKFAHGLFPFFFLDADFFKINYEAFAKEGYEKNVYAYASISEIAKAVAGIPWILFKTRGDEKKEVFDHPLLTLLARPNPRMARAFFFESLTSYYFLAGDSNIIAVGPDRPNAPPQELWTIRPDWVNTPTEFDKAKETETLLIGPPGDPAKQKEFPIDDVLHLRTFNPLSSVSGFAPTQAAARSIVQSNESKKWNVALLQNMARPPSILSVEGNLTPDQFNRMSDQIDKKYASPTNAGRPMLAEGGMKWQELGLRPADMDWLEGQKLSAREIGLVYGVPPEMIGDAANKTFANFKEARKSFYEQTVLPFMEFLKTELNAWLTPRFGDDLRLDFDTDQVPAFQEDRAELFGRLTGADFLTVNEKRDLAGFEDIEGGDVILQPLNLVPLGMGLPALDDGLKGKAFNFQHDEQKQIYAKQFDLRRLRFQDSVKTLVFRQLDADLSAAQRAIKGSATVDEARLNADRAIKDGQDLWFQLYDRIYETVGDDFAQATFDTIKGAEVPETKQTVRDIWQETIRAWVTTNAAARVVGIGNFTQGIVGRLIGKGIEDGLSILEISESLQQVRGLGTISDSRAERIARTEVITASNLGSQAAAQSTGLPLEKEWLTAGDDRVRGDADDSHSHRGLNGVRVPMKDPYVEPRTKEQLMFPADSSLGATAGNIIQCRCTEVYHTIGE